MIGFQVELKDVVQMWKSQEKKEIPGDGLISISF